MDYLHIIEFGVALFLGTGSGLLYAGAKKRKEDAGARCAQAQADVAETEAYNKRIASLSTEFQKMSASLDEANANMLKAKQQIVELQAQIDELNQKLSACEAERDAFKRLSEQRSVTIDQLNEEIELARKKNEAQAKRIARMRKKLEEDEDK